MVGFGRGHKENPALFISELNIMGLENGFVPPKCSQQWAQDLAQQPPCPLLDEGGHKNTQPPRLDS